MKQTRMVRSLVLAGMLALICSPAFGMGHGNKSMDHGSMDHKGMDHSGMDHSSMDKSTMDHGMGGATEAEVAAKINSIDADAGVINVDHGPVDALGWPAMTMDLPVTRRVDLSTVEAGQDVTLMLKQGRDKQFRVVEIK